MTRAIFSWMARMMSVGFMMGYGVGWRWRIAGDRHDRSLTKGLETVNLLKLFAPLRSGVMARGLDQSLTREPV